MRPASTIAGRPSASRAVPRLRTPGASARTRKTAARNSGEDGSSRKPPDTVSRLLTPPCPAALSRYRFSACGSRASALRCSVVGGGGGQAPGGLLAHLLAIPASNRASSRFSAGVERLRSQTSGLADCEMYWPLDRTRQLFGDP